MHTKFDNDVQFYIECNPRAASNVVPYCVGRLVNGRIHWKARRFSTLIKAEEYIRGKYPTATITHN